MAKRILVALAVAAGLGFAPEAQAQVSLGLKLGYALPTGDFVADSTGSAPMSDLYSGAFVLGLDALYRFTPSIQAGLYFQWNPAFVKSGICDAGVSCSGYDMRLGLEFLYAFMPDGSVNPWVSIGTGWQWTQFGASAGGVSASATFSGWEYFSLQAGVDFPLAKMFALGPYVGYSGGTYTDLSGISEIAGIPGSIPSEIRSFHGWFQFGLKGSLNL